MFGNVLLKSPGHVVPDAAIEAVLKGYNAAVGIARAIGDGSIEINHGGSEFAELSVIKESMEAYKDQAVMYFFGKDTVHEECIQPYVTALNDKAGIAIVSFINGDVAESAHEESKRSPDFFAHAEEFEPFINKMHQDLNYDLSATEESLMSPRTQRKLAATFGDGGGTLTVFTASGAAIEISSTVKETASFPWGTMQDTCGYKEATPARPSLLKKAIAAVTPMPRSTPTPSVVKDAAAPISKENAAADADPPKADLTPKKVLKSVTIPSNVRKENKKKAWWYKNVGFLPPNWQTVSTIEVEVEEDTIKDFKDLPQQHAATASTTNTAGSDAKVTKVGATTVVEHPDRSAAAQHRGKDVDPKHVSQPQVSAAFLPVLSEATKAALKKDFLSSAVVTQTRDLNSNVSSDPADIQGAENLHPDLAQQIGLNLEDTFKWSLEALVELGKIDTKALAILCQNYRFQYMRTLSKSATAKPTPADTQQQTTARPTLVNKSGTVPNTKTPPRKVMAM